MINIKKEFIIRDWSVEIGDTGLFMPPEIPVFKYRIWGSIKNTNVLTGVIKNIIDYGEYKIIDTNHYDDYMYILYSNDINPKYEKQYNNAFKRLSINNTKKYNIIDYLISLGYNKEIANKMIELSDNYNISLYGCSDILKMEVSDVQCIMNKINNLKYYFK